MAALLRDMIRLQGKASLKSVGCPTGECGRSSTVAQAGDADTMERGKELKKELRKEEDVIPSTLQFYVGGQL